MKKKLIALAAAVALSIGFIGITEAPADAGGHPSKDSSWPY